MTIIATYDDLNELPKHSVYQFRWKGNLKFAVRSTGERGAGDMMFDTLDDAERCAEAEKIREQEERGRHRRMMDDEAREKRAEADRVASFHGFDSASPLKFGRSRRVLEKRYNDRGVPRSRKEMIEQRIAEGWSIRDGRFEGPDGKWLTDSELTITGLRYAKYLISRKDG